MRKRLRRKNQKESPAQTRRDVQYHSFELGVVKRTKKLGPHANENMQTGPIPGISYSSFRLSEVARMSSETTLRLYRISRR